VCGLFGYVGKPANAKTIDRMRNIALHTESRRGGHAYGFAWVDEGGIMRHFKNSGTLAKNPWDMYQLEGAVAIIGHVRYATHGSHEDNINNHPHACDGGWIVHNGIVRKYRELSKIFGLSMMSQCDSEVLARMIENFSGTFEERVAEAVSYAESSCSVLGLWRNPLRIYCARAGNPLAYVKDGGKLFIASLKSSLPGNAEEFTDYNVAIVEAEKHVLANRKEAKTRRGQTDRSRARVAQKSAKATRPQNALGNHPKHDAVLF